MSMEQKCFWDREAADNLEQVLKTEEVYIVFEKKDGTVRTGGFTMIPSYLPVIPEDKVRNPRKHNPDVIVVFDLLLKEFRSIRKDSILSASVADLVIATS